MTVRSDRKIPTTFLFFLIVTPKFHSDTDRSFDNKIKMVAASKIGKEEFRLYSGRATWAEAVVQCREEGLQIAEVKSVAEAQALAVSMLRNRPRTFSYIFLFNPAM